jgi:hypothetical protein
MRLVWFVTQTETKWSQDLSLGCWHLVPAQSVLNGFYSIFYMLMPSIGTNLRFPPPTSLKISKSSYPLTPPPPPPPPHLLYLFILYGGVW